MIAIPAELLCALQDAKGHSLQLTDPETGEIYLLMPASQLVWDNQSSGFTKEEQDYLLREAGIRAGWDDPIMDIYNDLDPRKHT